MRFILNVHLPHDKFNAAVKDGTVGRKLGHILEELKPEAVYFTEQDGQRSAIVIVNLDSASQIPMYAEPWFLTFGADVEFKVAMTPEDLQKSGLEALGKKWA
jgi:hypothetical protein